MMTVFSDEYVAGMWRHSLERDLLWSVAGNRSNKQLPVRPKAYRAPSWSWMAVDGKVNPGLLPYDDALIEVENLQLEHLTDDNTLLIHWSWLRLRGSLKRLILMPHYSGKARSYGDWKMVVNGVHVSVLTESADRQPEAHVKLDAFYENFDKQNAAGSLYCMPGRVPKGDFGDVYVLLLELEDRERAVFRRIGLAFARGKEVKEKILARSGEEDKYPCEAYRDGLHTICIV